MSKILEAIAKMNEGELVRIIMEVYRRQAVIEKPAKRKARKRK